MGVLSSRAPLRADAFLPPGVVYDPGFGMPVAIVGDRPFHTMWIAAQYVADLLADGSAPSIERAGRVILPLLECLDAAPRSPTHGNLRWEHEDPGVEDLNAAVFFAIRVAPALSRHGSRLSSGTRAQLADGLRAALHAIVRIDVGPDYTNIATQSFAALLIGGAWLDERALFDVGAERLREWATLTGRTGVAHEFNSPVYTAMTVRALRLVETDVNDGELVRIAAHARLRQIMSFALHVNADTGRMAPPHCRAYTPFLLGQTLPEAAILNEWITEGLAPAWSVGLVQTSRGEVRETSDRERGTTLTSFHGHGFAMGTASRNLDTQNNRFIAGQSTVFGLHYLAADNTPGTVFAKYVLNDRWLGDYAATPSRPPDQVLLDQGAFRSVQSGSRAICAYAPNGLDGWQRIGSAKIAIAVARASDVRTVLCDGTETSLLHGSLDGDCDLPPNRTVGFDVGPVHLAIRPLSSRELQVNAPIRLRQRGDMLVLEIHDYLGPARTHWDQARPGSFFRGIVRSGFFAEATSANEGPLAELVTRVNAQRLVNEADPPCRPDQGARSWRIAHDGDNGAFGMTLDLHDWRMLDAWDANGPIALPMLEARDARQTASGTVRLGEATLRCPPGPAWLVRPSADSWVAARMPGAHGTVTLDVPNGRVRVDDATSVLIHCECGVVRIEHADAEARITLEGDLLSA